MRPDQAEQGGEYSAPTRAELDEWMEGCVPPDVPDADLCLEHYAMRRMYAALAKEPQP